MKSFLYDCAASIWAHYSDQIENLTVVFPSRRAERYFQFELTKLGITTKPQFATIDSVMQRFSELETENNLTILTRLYNIYTEFHPGENFDEFYSFGKLLLTDFDSIDKYLVNAKELYSIVSETKDVELRFEDDTHRLAYEFWRKFQHSKAELHKEQQFFRIWQSLGKIYDRLRSDLAAAGKAYQGMIYRNAAQNIEQNTDADSGKYIFVGLNALSTSELMVLKKLHRDGRADFIWDYDPQWQEDTMHEAAYFVTHNMAQLPMAEYFIKSAIDTDRRSIEVVATPSEVLQCKIALSDPQITLDERTAVVLTDENLLEPLLYSLPDEAQTPNISIGFPIRTTLTYKLIQALVALQKSRSEQGFYHRQICTILAHPFVDKSDLISTIESQQKLFMPAEYFTNMGATLKSIFTQRSGSAFELHGYISHSIETVLEHCASKISDTERFAIGKIASAMDLLIGAIRTSSISISENLYTKLLFETLSTLQIPFVGHSGQGLQITGILETRALNFENVVIMSLTDDNFPSAQLPSSYIPQNLRVAYGLPSATEHTAIWSYYFYRLLQRASNVRLIYCNATTDTTSGEQSRYLYQLAHNSRYKTHVGSVKFALSDKRQPKLVVQAQSEQTSSAISSRALSPSAINRYIACPLAFYFSDIATIAQEPQAMSEGLSGAEIGNILHEVMQNLYQERRTQQQIQGIRKQHIDVEVERVIEKITGTKNGKTSINDTITEIAIRKMVGNIVRYDAHRSEPFEVIEIEKQISTTVNGIQIRGTADRIDKMASGTIRIVDYKSGGDRNKCSSIEQLFNGKYKEQNKAIVQLLIYSEIIGSESSDPVSAALYVARSMGDESFDPIIKIGSHRLDPIAPDMLDELRVALAELLSAMRSELGSFAPSPNAPECCLYCPYKPICLR